MYDLSSVPDKLLEAANEAALQVAHLILGVAQVGVRVDTGSLRDSGRIERGGEGKYWAVVRVRFGGYVVNPRSGKLVDYAAIVERRYPYLKPAVDAFRDQLNDVIRQYCLVAMRDIESHGVLKFK